MELTKCTLVAHAVKQVQLAPKAEALSGNASGFQCIYPVLVCANECLLVHLASCLQSLHQANEKIFSPAALCAGQHLGYAVDGFS